MLKLINNLRRNIKLSTNRSTEIILLSEKLNDIIYDFKYSNKDNPSNLNPDDINEILIDRIAECTSLFDGNDNILMPYETEEIYNYMKAGYLVNSLYGYVFRPHIHDYSKIIINEKIYEKLLKDCKGFPMEIYHPYFDEFNVRSISDDVLFIKLRCTCEPCKRNSKIINEYMKNNEMEKLKDLCEN